jgi:hypothetical protein
VANDVVIVQVLVFFNQAPADAAENAILHRIIGIVVGSFQLDTDGKIIAVILAIMG